MEQNLGGNLGSLSVSNVPPIRSTYDATANDSNKSWVVPAGEMWKLNFAHVILATTATAGNRQVLMEVLNELGQSVMDVAAGATQAASTTRHYGFLQGIFRETSFIDDEIQVPIPLDFFLGPGYTLTFKDDAAIAAAADDMTVAFQYQRLLVGS